MKCDYLNVTLPEKSMSDIRNSLLELILQCGAAKVRTQGQVELFRLGKGTVRLEEKRGYHVLGVSGSFLTAMREKGVFDQYLCLVSDVPHKVTRMDIAHDVSVYTPPVLKRLYKRVSSAKGISLTRKRVKKHNKVVRPSLYSNDDTGTLYLNNRSSEVYAKIYDKRNEVLDRTGNDLGVDITRYELTVTNKVGISLGDAHSPDSCFWHFMSQVLSPPTGYVGSWVPGGLSFSIPEQEKRVPAELLREYVDGSGDIEVMLGLASDIGPSGLDLLIRLIRSRATNLLPDQPQTSQEAA